MASYRKKKMRFWQLFRKLRKHGIRTILPNLEIWLNLNLKKDKLWLLLEKIFPNNIGIN